MRLPNKFIIIINSTVISIIIDFFHSYIEKNRKTLLVSENSRNFAHEKPGRATPPLTFTREGSLSRD